MLPDLVYFVSLPLCRHRPWSPQIPLANHPLSSSPDPLQDDWTEARDMTLLAHPQPTSLASSATAFGPAQLASVFPDTARGMAPSSARPAPSNSNATTNLVVASAASPINPMRTQVVRNAAGISIASKAIYSAIGNTSVNSLIEVERRGAERTAQVPALTWSTRDHATNCTEARTPRTACPTFTRRPLFTMTSTTNTPLRRASGDLRSLH